LALITSEARRADAVIDGEGGTRPTAVGRVARDTSCACSKATHSATDIGFALVTTEASVAQAVMCGCEAAGEHTRAATVGRVAGGVTVIAIPHATRGARAAGFAMKPSKARVASAMAVGAESALVSNVASRVSAVAVPQSTHSIGTVCLTISAAVSSVAHAVVVHGAHTAIVCRVAPKVPHTQPKTWHRAAGGLQADNSWQQGGVNHKKRDQNLRRATVGHRAVEKK